jgi:hypothetical protein
VPSKTLRLLHFSRGFPTPINRVLFSLTAYYVSETAKTNNRLVSVVSVHFSHTFPWVHNHDLFSLSICKWRRAGW